MNYRHAYHAGNAADCLKHAVLVWVLRALARKEKPFFVLDTHAGAGRTDLSGEQAQRTGEAAGGILRLLDDTPAPLAAYVDLVRSLGLYPGSPAIIAALLRPGDRAVCCELHPDDHAELRRALGRDRRLAIHCRDGFEAIRAFLPPQERRALTLIDPPYERPDDHARVIAGMEDAAARLPGGAVLAWYPVKHLAPVRALHAAVRAAGLRDVLACEVLARTPFDAARLNGSGLLVANPPYRFEQEVPAILAALLDRLGQGEPGQAATLTRLTDE